MYFHVQIWIQQNPLCLYLKYNNSNPNQANSCIATETSFWTDKPSMGISKHGGILNFGYHMFNLFTSSISLIVSNLFEFCEPYMLGHTAVW